MNNARRKAIGRIRDDLEARKAEVEKLKEVLDGIKEDIDGIVEEEQEYFDNMPESLQGGEKGEMAEAAIRALTDAAEKIEAAASDLDSNIDEAISELETAAE